jgi:hypothetical protein
VVVSTLLDEALRKYETALFSERDVDEGDVRPQSLGLPKPLGDRRGDAGDGQTLSLEEHARSQEEGVVVIDDQATDRHPISVASTASDRITASGNSKSSATRAAKSLLAPMTACIVEAMLPPQSPNSSIEEDRPVEPISMLADSLEYDAEDALLLHAWRREQLCRLGLPRSLAERFADLVDWHALAELVERGCPAELALEIVR